MGKHLHQRNNSRYRSDIGDMSHRIYETGSEPGREMFVIVPKDDVVKLGLMPDWNEQAFLSPKSKRSWAGTCLYLTESDSSIFKELYRLSIGHEPYLKPKDNGARFLVTRLPGIYDPIIEDRYPELPEPTPYSVDIQLSSSTGVTVWNSILQSVTDFIMFVMVWHIVLHHQTQGPKLLNTKFRLLKVWIESKTPSLRGSCYDDSTRMMWIFTQRTSFPVCKTCGCEFGRMRRVHLSKSYDAYQPHCSSRCARIDDAAVRRYKDSMLRTYGVEAPLQSRHIVRKIRKTMLERYGVEHLMHDPNHVYHLLEKRNSNQLLVNRPKEDGIVFDSKWELQFYRFCKLRGMSIEYHPCHLTYEFGGGTHRYYPDFMVDGKLYEVKGACFINDDGTWTVPFRKNGASESEIAMYRQQGEAKRQCALRNGVIIVDSVDTKDLCAVMGVSA